MSEYDKLSERARAVCRMAYYSTHPDDDEYVVHAAYAIGRELIELDKRMAPEEPSTDRRADEKNKGI